MTTSLEDRPQAPGDPQESGAYEVTNDDNSLHIAFRGRWDLRAVLRSDAELRAMTVDSGTPVVIDLHDVQALDTMGALSVCQLRDRLAKAGGKVDLQVEDQAQQSLLEQVDQANAPKAAPKRRYAFGDRIVQVGKWAYDVAHQSRDLLSFFGELCVVAFRTMLNPRRLRGVSVVANMQATGLNAVPIVGMMSFLIGVVLAYQGADQLRNFGAEVFTVNLLGISVLREIGILMTAIIIAGRSGSSYTAQIGTMKINQEIDAMRTIGLDPMEVLVLPRVLALTLTLPLLAFFADMMGLLGGAIMCKFVLGIGFDAFTTQLNQLLQTYNTALWAGLVKAPVFAVVIALVGCFHGMEVTGSAESVGQRTTQAVVQAIFLVIVLDAIFSIVFSALKF